MVEVICVNEKTIEVKKYPEGLVEIVFRLIEGKRRVIVDIDEAKYLIKELRKVLSK